MRKFAIFFCSGLVFKEKLFKFSTVPFFLVYSKSLNITVQLKP